MSDMPSAREHGLYDLRRKRATVVMGAITVAATVGAMLAGNPALFALPVVAAIAFGALPSWIGVEPRYPVPSIWAAVYSNILGFGVPMVGVLLMFVMLNKGDLRYAALVPAAVTGALVYSAYRWRYLGEAMARVRGVRAGMPVVDRLWRHYLGYALGLAGGGVALSATRGIDWSFGTALFAIVFLAGKAAVDLSLPQPPLKTERLSTAALQLAAMSPVWFGLPWGVALTFALAALTPADWSVLTAVSTNTVTVVYVTIASVVVFTAFALVAFLIEVATGEG
jgi:hypothetical protein